MASSSATVAPSSGIALQAARRRWRKRGVIQIYSTASRGFNVLLWRDGELGYALVSDVDPRDLSLLASKLAGPA